MAEKNVPKKTTTITWFKSAVEDVDCMSNSCDRANRIATDGDSDDVGLLQIAPKGSLLGISKDGHLMFAKADANVSQDPEYKFDIEWIGEKIKITSSCYTNRSITGHPNDYTVDGGAQYGGQNEWYVETNKEDKTIKSIYIIAEEYDGQKLYFYVVNTDGRYEFKLGNGDNKEVEEADMFEFES